MADWHAQWAQYCKWLHALPPDEEEVPADTFHRKATEWLQSSGASADAVFALAAALRRLFARRQAFCQWLLTLRGRIPPRFGRHQEEAFEDGGPFTPCVTYNRAWDDAFALPGAPPEFDVNDVLRGLSALYWSDYADLAMPLREPEPPMPPSYQHTQPLTYERPYRLPGFKWDRQDTDLMRVFGNDSDEDTADALFIKRKLFLIDNICTWVVRCYTYFIDTRGFGLRSDAYHALMPQRRGEQIIEGEHKLQHLMERALAVYRHFLEFPDSVSAFVFGSNNPTYGANPALFARPDYDTAQGGGMDVLFTRDIPHMLAALVDAPAQ